jgi:hypothetical protein
MFVSYDVWDNYLGQQASKLSWEIVRKQFDTISTRLEDAADGTTDCPDDGRALVCLFGEHDTKSPALSSDTLKNGCFNDYAIVNKRSFDMQAIS